MPLSGKVLVLRVILVMCSHLEINGFEPDDRCLDASVQPRRIKRIVCEEEQGTVGKILFFRLQQHYHLCSARTWKANEWIIFVPAKSCSSHLSQEICDMY